jgi:hypothetical protein
MGLFDAPQQGLMGLGQSQQVQSPMGGLANRPLTQATIAEQQRANAITSQFNAMNPEQQMSNFMGQLQGNMPQQGGLSSSQSLDAQRFNSLTNDQKAQQYQQQLQQLQQSPSVAAPRDTIPGITPRNYEGGGLTGDMSSRLQDEIRRLQDPNYQQPFNAQSSINDTPMGTQSFGSNMPMLGQQPQQFMGQQPQAMQSMQPMQPQGQPVNTQTVQPNFMGQTPFGQPQTGQFTSTNPFVQAAQANAQGNIAGALQATAANRINQQTPYGSLQYQQTGTDAQGNPIWSANQQLSPELQQLTQSSLAGLQASQANPMYGINPGDTYSNAIMQRLQPQQRQQVEALDAQLANQGIMPGSEAYNRAKTLLGQTQNDALTSAIVGGMQTGLQAQGLQNTTAANIRNLATPGYVNPYNQAAVAGPDYLSAYTSQNATDIARQNAEAAQRSSLLSGLAGLGSSAILGGTGANSALGGLLGLGASGANALSNSSLWSQLFNSGGVPSSDIFSNGNLVDSSGNVLLNSGILESGIM